jgi:hypothetical protein
MTKFRSEVAGALSVSFTVTQKIACLERELRFRFRVYPRRVERGTMSQSVALHEIAVMKAIIEDYCKKRKPELDFSEQSK